ncbi:hypothetical protein [Micromonospora polyrhachis]|uniref:hypothetical protein n=1 Tax=Micromonospora polyrhachis TaxID=1282883 RepID=UPI0035E41CA5
MRALYARLRGRLSEPVAGLVTRTGLRRGFAELIVLPGADFLADGAEIYRRVPVRHAVLTGVDPGLVAAIAASGLLARLSSLDLSDNPIGDAGVRALVTSPHLGKVRWLGLEGCGIGIDGAEALAAAASQVLPNLRYLRFGGNAVDLVPHGEGWDAVSGQGPVDVHLPELGVRLDERYGPFPWLDARLAWTDFVDFTHV